MSHSTDNILKSLAQAMSIFENNFPLASLKKTNFNQQPLITLLNCSDSRVPVNIFGDSFNRIFCVENIGNQVKTSEGSIMYGLMHLHTPIMLVVGHSDCGALKAANSDYSKEPEPIIRELNIVKRSLTEIAYIQPLNEDPQVKFTQLAELNVDMQIRYLLENGSVAELVKNRSLSMIGMVVDLHNVYNEGYGKTYIINLNGEQDPAKIKQLINQKDLSVQIQRLT
ncbi:MAG: carbonic anhydrase [Syntrophomonadaceae bacterium]|jgi:carbonic anhydrase